MPSSFEDLVVFQRAIDLIVAVYQATERFPRSELYGLTAQLRRAAVSVASNIAESQGRLSFGESRQLLSQARGSLYEVDAQMIVGLRLGFVEGPQQHAIRRQIIDVARPLSGLIDHVRRKEREARQKRVGRVARTTPI